MYYSMLKRKTFEEIFLDIKIRSEIFVFSDNCARLEDMLLTPKTKLLAKMVTIKLAMAKQVGFFDINAWFFPRSRFSILN